MKKFYRTLALVGLLSLSTLVSCQKNNDNNDQTVDDGDNGNNNNNNGGSSERDVTLPTEIPPLYEDSVQIHYQRSDNTYLNWELWLWTPNSDGATYNFNYQDDFGLVASYALSTFGENVADSSLGFIIKKPNWAAKDVESDRFIEFSSLVKDKNGVYHVYLVSGDKNVYISTDLKVADSIKNCKLMYNKATKVFNFFLSASTTLSGYKIYKNNEVLAEGTINNRKQLSYDLDLADGEIPDITAKYEIEVTFAESGVTKKVNPSMNVLYSLDKFNDSYYYDGELGALYSNESTTFKVWSPASSSITLKLYNSGTPKSYSSTLGDDSVIEEVQMTKGEKGVFEATVSGDLEGKYYTYLVTNSSFPNGTEIVDPYAKSCGINGLRGMVVDFSKTNPEGWDDVKINEIPSTALTVYETHVADVSSSETWGGTASKAKKFSGLIETGTRYNETIKTGFDHILDLGVNAVQLLPIFDQANDEGNPTFNWGYNPLNYNCVEGVYSSDPYDGYTRIKELKEVSKAFNNNGINVIMDVVYNHVNGAKGSNFDVLMPGYYFRYDGNGNLTNGSGCGNETASENKMYRKFIVDSTEFWAKEYKFGGFRFDLMGCHDVDTMNEVSANLHNNVSSYITIYGEPWTGGTSGLANPNVPATQANANSLDKIGQFNDQMRDSLIKGGLNAASETGWITSTAAPSSLDTGKICSGLLGITQGTNIIKDPNMNVNYVTCHDNYTLRDRIVAAGVEDEATVKKMAMLANSVVFTSQAITFMLAGEEMYRTKQGNSNSYNASYAINELDYSKLAESDINLMYENYKKLIEFKQNTSAVTLSTNLDILSSETANTLDKGSVIRADINYDNKNYVIIHTNGYETTHSTIDLSGYELILDTLGTTTSLTSAFVPSAYQSIIAVKNA